MLREGLDIGLLVSAKLDGVVHAAEDGGGVRDRLLVAQLRTGRVQVGHVRALVVGGDLERGPGPGRRLLEDERDLLAVEVLDLGAGVLRELEGLGEPQEVAQLDRLEVDLLEEAAVLQVERHGRLPIASERGVTLDGTGHAVRAAAAATELEALDRDHLDARLA
jgi:hypothetical protein